MELEEKGWRGSHWELTAPESYVLVYGPKAGGSRPFKLALMELVAGKCLVLTDAKDSALFGLWKRSVALLAPGARHQPLDSRSLSSLLDLLGEMSPRTTRDGNVGIPVAKFARKARRKYGWMGGYAETEVMTDLVNRGFYERQEQRGLWKITRAGKAARTELERNLATHGRERLSLWVDDDPAQALAFLGLAGSSSLLMKELHPDLRRLRERRHTETGAYLGAEGGAEGNDPEAGWGDSLNDLDLGALDLGALDGLDGALSAIDAAVGSGGGGDGGGGGGS
jgi:hypothetical protein